jgi:hypothetical protein
LDSEIKIDKFARTENQLCLESLWKQLPQEFKSQSMYNYIQSKGGQFLERNHPSKESHLIWKNYLINKIKYE